MAYTKKSRGKNTRRTSSKSPRRSARKLPKKAVKKAKVHTKAQLRNYIALVMESRGNVPTDSEE